jgi:hypothetical protein
MLRQRYRYFFYATYRLIIGFGFLPVVGLAIATVAVIHRRTPHTDYHITIRQDLYSGLYPIVHQGPDGDVQKYKNLAFHRAIRLLNVG